MLTLSGMPKQETIGIYEWFGVVEKDGLKIGLGRTFNGNFFAVATGCYVGIDVLPDEDCGECFENSVNWLGGIVNNPYQAERAAHQLILEYVETAFIRAETDSSLYTFLYNLAVSNNWPIGEYAKAQGKALPTRK